MDPGPPSNSSILYNIWVHAEQTTSDAPPSVQPRKSSTRDDYAIFKLAKAGFDSLLGLFGVKLPSGEVIPIPLVDYINVQAPHSFAMTRDGASCAIVFHSELVIRCQDDDFATIKGSFKVPSDPHPQWQRLAWSPDGNRLALATSTGDIYILDSLGSNLHTINGRRFEMDDGVAGLIWRSNLRHLELVVLTYDGQLRRFVVSTSPRVPPIPLSQFLELEDSMNDPTVINMTQFHRFATALGYHGPSDILAVGGSISNPQEQSQERSVSFWKLLDETPYIAPVTGALESMKGGRGLLSGLSSSETKAAICQISFSPSGAQTATLDTQGNLTIWDSKKGLRQRYWSSEAVHKLSRADSIMDLSGAPSVAKEVKWWDEGALILLRENGMVVVFGPLDLENASATRNLLGSAPEKFASQAHVSNALDGRFFIHEVSEALVKVPKSRKLNTDDEGRDFASGDLSSSDSPGSLWSKARSFIGTEGRSPVSPLGPSYENRRQVTLRLLSLSSTTPEELFKAKVESEEYGVALKIARLYGLDADPVFQRRFCQEPVSKNTIEDYLSKVQDPLWVLRECKDRLPKGIKSTKLLLEYGIQKAVPQCILEWQDSKLKDATTPESAQVMKEIRNPEIVAKLLLTSQLSDEDVEVLFIRLILLHYYDRLMTYTSICGTADKFDEMEFSRFRTCDLVSAAIDYGYEDKFGAIEYLFTYHGRVTLPMRLVILNQIPETTDPLQYEAVLPVINNSDEMEEAWETKRWRQTTDWVETPSVLKRLLRIENPAAIMVGDDLAPLIAAYSHFINTEIEGGSLPEHPECVEQHADPLPTIKRPRLSSAVPEHMCGTHPVASSTLSEWFVRRARQLESKSGLVDNAICLLQLGERRGVTGLQPLLDDMKGLRTLVYDCGKTLLTLNEYKGMSSYDQFAALLEEAKPSSIITLLRTRAAGIIASDNDLLAEDPHSADALIPCWMKEQSQKRRLNLVHKIIQASRPLAEVPLEKRIIRNQQALVQIALGCIYSCRDTSLDTWVVMSEILESLPTREPGISSEMTKLLDDVDAFESHLVGCELLQKYNLAKPIADIRSISLSDDKDRVVQQLLAKIAFRGVKAVVSFTPAQWAEIYSDLDTLCSKVFTFISSDVMNSIFCKALLKAGNLKLALDYLDRTSNSEALIIAMAAEHFNSATASRDEGIDLSLQCLKLAPMSPEIKKELDLIEAIKRLDALGSEALPVQVRVAKNRLDYISKVLKTQPRAYKLLNDFIEIAELMGRGSNEDKLHVTLLAAESAFDQQDYFWASKACSDMIQQGFRAAWMICKKIGLCDDFHDLTIRLHLTGFAMAHCPKKDVEILLLYRRSLEARENCRKMGIDVELVEEEVDDDNNVNGSPLATSYVFEDQTLQSADRFLSMGTDAIMCQHWKSDSLHSIISEQADELSRLHSFYDAPRHGSDDSIYGKFESPSLGESNLVDSVKLELFRLTSPIDSDHQLVADLAVKALKAHDISMLVSLLYSLPLLSNARSVFESVLVDCKVPSQAENFVRLAIHFFVLEILVLDNSIRPLTPLSDLFQYDAQRLLALFETKWVPQYEKKRASVPSHLPEDIYPDNTALAEAVAALHFFQQKMMDLSKVRELQTLNVDVDVAKFSEDDAYKSQAVFKVARNADPERLKQALQMAAKYGFPDSSAVLRDYLSWAISDSSVSVATIRSTLGPFGVQLMSRPDELISVVRELEAGVSGKDHERIKMLLELRRDALRSNKRKHLDGAEEASTLDNHIKLLSFLQKVKPAVDYQQVTLDPDNAYKALMEVASNSNVVNLGKLAKELNDLIFSSASSLSSSKFYSKYITQTLENVSPSRELLQRASTVIADLLTRLNQQDFNACVRQFISTEAALSTPYATRVMVATTVAEFLRKTKKSSTEASVETIEMLAKHAEFVESLHDLLHNGLDIQQNFAIGYYLHRLDLARRDQKKVEVVFEQLAGNGVDLEVVGHLRSEYARVLPHIVTIEQLYYSVVDRIVGSLSGSPTSAESTASLSDELHQLIVYFPPNHPQVALKLLEAVLSSLSRASMITFDDDSFIVTLKLKVLEHLREKCQQQSNLPKDVKILVLELLQRHKEFYSKGGPSMKAKLKADAKLIEIYTSSKIITQITSVSGAEPTELNTLEEKIAAFDKLLIDARKSENFSNLITLLIVWSQGGGLDEHDERGEASGGGHPFSPCWRKIFQEIATLDDVPKLIQLREQLPRSPAFMTEEDEELVAGTLSSKPLVQLNFCLMSSYDSLFSDAIEKLRGLVGATRSSWESHMPIVWLDRPDNGKVLASSTAPRLQYGEHFDAHILYRIIRTGMMTYFISSDAFFEILLDFILRCSMKTKYWGYKRYAANVELAISAVVAKVDTVTEAAFSIENTVASLCLEGFYAHAGGLVLLSKRVPQEVVSRSAATIALPIYLAAADKLLSEAHGSSSSNEPADSPPAVSWAECRSKCRHATTALLAVLGN